MLDIDCLLKNTDFIDGVRKYIKYVGNAHAEDGIDASFSSVFKRLRKEGIEVDIETAGQLYLSELPVNKDANFSTREEVEHLSGREFDETSKNLLLAPTKTGEQEIGDLPPRKAIAKRIADAFNSEYIEDQSTKSILRGIQDMYTKTLDRLIPAKEKTADHAKKPFEQIFEEGLDRLHEGYRDTETGLINNLATLHEGVKKELKELTDKLEASGDYEKAEQWKKHVENFQDSVYNLALTSKEAKEGVEGALMEAGFGKKNKAGEEQIDWHKLAGENNSVEQLRAHVIDALTEKGKFDKPTAEKVAHALQKEFLDKYARMLEVADKSQERLKNTWEKPTRQPVIKTDDLVSEQVKEWQNYIGYKDREGAPLIVSRKAAADALRHVLVEAGISRKAGKSGELTIDINKLSNEITSPADIKKIASDYFSNEKNGNGTPKYDAATVDKLSDAIDGMYQELFNKVREHVEGKQAAIEKTWDPNLEAKPARTISDIISSKLKEWSQYKRITNKPDAPLKFTKNEAQRITGEVLKNSEEFGKVSQNGNKSINWQALAEKQPNGIALNEIIKNHLINNEGWSKSDAAETAASISRDYTELLRKDVMAHAQAILDMKQKATERDTPERKTAIHRLAELSSLGIFEKQNEKLLYHVLGVNDANAQDLQSLKDIAQAVTQIRHETGSDKNYINSFAYQSADRLVAHLIEQNKDDQARLLKITSAINHTFGLMNMSLIGNPYNLLENNWSGQNALWGARGELVKQMGRKNEQLFNDRKLWWSVWKDVAIGGVEYGGAGDKWSHIGGYVDNLNSVNFAKDPVKAIKTAVITPFRALLNASDAANKAVLHQKGMLLMMHKAMTSIGYSNDQAANHLHEALYGVSYDQARVKAAELVDKYGDRIGIGNSPYARERAINRWANDLVKANLNMSGDASINGGQIPIGNADIIEAAIESGFHAAAVSLGHEPNNPQSKGMKAGKQAAMMEEQKLIERGKTQEAAWLKFKNNIYWNGVKRMQAGGMNWAALRLDGLGFGLISYGKVYGKKQIELDFSSKEELLNSMQDRILASRKMTRAVTSMSLAALAIASMTGYGALRKKGDEEDDDESALMSGVQGVKGSYELNRMMGKAGPDLAFLAYLSMLGEDKDGADAVYGAIDYAQNLFNANPEFTTLGHLAKAKMQSHRDSGNGKGKAQAAQEIGKIPGDLVSLPLYKPFKSVYQIIMHHATGAPIVNPYTKATARDGSKIHDFAKNATLGAVGGGAVQDLVNTLPAKTVENIGLEDWLYSKPSSKKKKSKRY